MKYRDEFEAKLKDTSLIKQIQISFEGPYR